MATPTTRQSRILTILPSSWVPYAELMRLDKPAGFYAFYVPHLIGLGYGACLASPVLSSSHLLCLGILFLLYSVILRGAACTWNDNVDQDFDRQVARTRLRPIARGAVSTTQGHVFTGFLILAQIPFLMAMAPECVYHAVVINILFGVYALMKRVTYYPQVVLGIPFAWAIPMSCAALGVDPFTSDRIVPTLSLCVANVLWTIIYDTIYAHQDVHDDVKAGVKSMAVRFANSTKLLVGILAALQVILLVVVGQTVALSPVYFLFACGGTLSALTGMIANVDLKKPSSCAKFFHDSFWYVGGSMILGFAAEYATQDHQLSRESFSHII